MTIKLQYLFQLSIKDLFSCFGRREKAGVDFSCKYAVGELETR